MTKLFFEAPNCQGATSELTGRHYKADKQGFIDVPSSADAKFLTANGYIAAGGMPKLRKFYVCECGWEASIASCPKCNRTDLLKVER